MRFPIINLKVYTLAFLGVNNLNYQDDEQVFSTGAKRDTDEGKLRYDLIPISFLESIAVVFTEGSEHYGDRNWQKGIPVSRYYASHMRHLYSFLTGDTSEDHLSKAIWNLLAVQWTLRAIEEGELPCELDDRDDLL